MSVVTEFISNISMFAGIGMEKNFKDPKIYCLDSGFEVFSGIVSILLISYSINLNSRLYFLAFFGVPYAYKIILGLINAIEYCEKTEPLNVFGSKTTIIATIFSVKMSSLQKLLIIT